MTCSRKEHQPTIVFEEAPEPTLDELEHACGKTAALILAIECGTTPLKVRFEGEEVDEVVCKDDEPTARPLQRYEGETLLARTCSVAAAARFSRIAVLAGGCDETRRQLRAEVERAAAATGIGIPVLDHDVDADRKATRVACGFTINELTKGVLDKAHSPLEGDPALDSVAILSCDQIRIAPRHLLKVCRAFREDPSLDMAASWIEWLRRTPLILSRRFLEGLDASSLTHAAPFGDRPAPALAAREVIFGEEKLAANAPVPHGVEEFFEQTTLSAREAVALARAERAAEEKAAGTPDADKARERARKADRARPKADRLLVSLARGVLERGAAETADIAGEKDALARADAWARRNRMDFPLLMNPAHRASLAYLDSAATAQRVGAAISAQAEFDTAGNANIYRGAYALSARATARFNEARATLERSIGAGKRETVFTMNASAAANLVAQAWGEWNIGTGDLIVSTVEEHHSNMVPWLMLAERKGAHVAYIPLRGDGRLDQDAYDALLAKRPKLVCVAHMSNVFGTENPVREMARKAHEIGARFYLDAAQSAPHTRLDVHGLGVDFVGISAHKMYGPLGIGALWISPEAFEEMDPVAGGGGAISHVGLQSYYLRRGAIQYEVGTPPIAQAIGWAASLDYLDALGFDAIERHSAAMTRYLVRGLHHIDNLTVWGDHTRADGQTGLVSFTLAGITPLALGTFCGRLGVAIRTGGHCAVPLSTLMGVTGTGRASMGVHTDKDDIDALLVAVEACRRVTFDSWKEGR